MEIFIKIDESVEFEYISENAEYMLRETLEYNPNTFIEHYFEDGAELIDYIDTQKLLRNELPYISLVHLVLYSLANKFYRLGV